MRKFIILVGISIISLGPLNAESFSIYTGIGANNTELIGVSLGGDIWYFLQFQIDIFKYLKKDSSLSSDNPLLDRSDFFGLSGNFTLKLPIHFLPKLDKLHFLQPYFLAGYGYSLESLNGDYISQPDSEDNTGIFSKIRAFKSFGGGLIIWLIPKVGIKFEYRSINIAEHKEMGLPSRNFNKITFGLCF
jgi:hypothetical protein